MSNFSFLQNKPEYKLFAAACMEAESVYFSAPSMCAIGCRKALELAVKWVYSADTEIEMPYRDNLQALIHEYSFRTALDETTWSKLPFIIKLGNLAVHTEKNIQKIQSLASLQGLFEFVQWIDYCYGDTYEEREFSEEKIPKEKVVLDVKKIREQESLLNEKEAEITGLRLQIEELSKKYTETKHVARPERIFEPKALLEAETRKAYIDLDLSITGWDANHIEKEYPVTGMADIPDQKGFVDYVLLGKDGAPLALIEVKRTCKSPKDGQTQARLYADCIEKMVGRRPMIFLSNGFETYFWDDQKGPMRRVSSVFTQDDLQKLMNRRNEAQDLSQVTISNAITDRYYQKEAIRAVCENLAKGIRRHLLVMATGTGKTRTAASLVDVLSRGKQVTNVLFLADRTALVKQARDSFRTCLPEMSLCNLCTNKDDYRARVVFSTYPTMLNAIDMMRKEDGTRLFSPAHFDLIIIDESHRSIFKKYRAIFDYFDAVLVGLTATPKMDVHCNTYEFFQLQQGVPTYAYDYETAVKVDHNLVPYYNYEVTLKFLEDGIVYDELEEYDKERYEDDFAEDDEMPDIISSERLNKFVFNKDTVVRVIQDLMTRGIKVAGGDRLGKTIIFAQNKRHADFIVDCFNELYPQYKGVFAQRVVCDDAYAQNIIDNFKVAENNPHIAVSVDMMDTGIDVPEVVNLVFFKKVRSKVKFWQMIGRGTRLCPNLACVDEIDGEHIGKRKFLIFDYCQNFEYFRQNKQGYESIVAQSLTEKVFSKKIHLIEALQQQENISANEQELLEELIEDCQGQIASLDKGLIAVQMKREFVERYQDRDKFTHLTEVSKGEILKHLAPLIESRDHDEAAKRFDNLMYGLMLARLQGKKVAQSRKNVHELAKLLQAKTSIPQVKAKAETITKMASLNAEQEGVLEFERIRKELRGLMQFLDLGGKQEQIVFTNLTDVVVEQKEGQALDPAYDFEDYKAKVNRYIHEHINDPIISRLKNNIPLSKSDAVELERIFTKELGNKEAYSENYGETPFGLLIRKVAKLDHQAAMDAFARFMDDEAMNQQQREFVKQLIQHIELNGYMEDESMLLQAPFDKPVSFMHLFDISQQKELVQTLKSIRENAIYREN